MLNELNWKRALLCLRSVLNDITQLANDLLETVHRLSFGINSVVSNIAYFGSRLNKLPIDNATHRY